MGSVVELYLFARKCEALSCYCWDLLSRKIAHTFLLKKNMYIYSVIKKSQLIHAYCNNSEHLGTFRAYLHITNVEVMFKYIFVFKILRQTIVEQSEVEIFTK